MVPYRSAWKTRRKHKFKATVPITAVALTDDEAQVFATSTSGDYNFISTAPSFGQRCSGFLWLSILLLVIAALARYVLKAYSIL